MAQRAVARGHGGYSTDRLYIDNISNVNRVLAIFRRDCQGSIQDLAWRGQFLYLAVGAVCLSPDAPAFEEPVAQKTRAIRRARRPIIPANLTDRVPPGQVIATRWPVLHQGDVPPFDPATWDLQVCGLVDSATSWSWEQWQGLPMVTTDGDLHCVTRWSSLGHTWSGVSSRALCDLARVKPSARFVMLHGNGGYTANLAIEDFLDRRVVLATHHDGELLTPEHGAPLRAVVPARYAWKSVKWLRGVEFLGDNEPGLWESFGYSNSADPWREERFEPE
jgi:DMSO/TMAO reductase YedYZ molybdopterin-dependent catalytic subunit